MRFNNRMKFIVSIALLLIFIIMPLSFAASYSLPEAVEHIKVKDDGTTTITDNITYSISGQVNGVTRIIPLSGKQSITNLEVETPGYYNTVEVQTTSNQQKIKVWLYKDEAKTQKVSDTEVTVIFHYDLLKGVKIYNDIAELQYMSWGNGWEESLNKLTTYIEIPGSSKEVEYWNNPDTYLKESTWTQDNVLTSQYTGIPSQTSVEQRLLMPKSYFTSTANADVINKDAKQQIEKDQKDYKNQQDFNNMLWSIPAILSAIMLVLPAGMYMLWGRNPKIAYDLDYESQIPTDDSPVFVNAMIPGIVEEIDGNAFTATLLDLIDRKYYKMVVSNEEDTILRRIDRDTAELKQYEIDIIEFLQDFEDEGQKLSLNTLTEYDSSLRDFMDAWKIDAYSEVPRTRVRQLYDKSKENLMSGYNILALFLGVAFLFGLLMFATGPFVMIGYILAILLIIEQLMLFFFVDTPLGRWTSEGKEFHDRWKNFEKYIKDYSLIKQRPPASVQVWGKYLVYATALGCADKVTENMKKYVAHSNRSEDILLGSDVVSLGYFWGFYHINRVFVPIGFNSSNFEDTGFGTGSFGDIGGLGSGGFGGGGGGVF